MSPSTTRAGPESVSAKVEDDGKSVAAAIAAARASVREAVHDKEGRDVTGGVEGVREDGRGLCEAVGTKAIWKEWPNRVDCGFECSRNGNETGISILYSKPETRMGEQISSEMLQESNHSQERGFGKFSTYTCRG